MRRLGRTLVGAAMASLVIAAPAFGAGTVSITGNTAVFTGTNGDDEVTVFVDPTYVYFAGAGVTAGSGCQADTRPQTVHCNRDPITRLDLEMGAGADSATNTSGFPTTFNGGPGDDQFDAGSGALPDDVHGGSGIDTVRYDTSTLNLTISLDDVANDGAPGAHANIHSDVEDVTAGSGNDRLIGSDANNRLEGGPGNDTLIGNGGEDALIGGDGNDSIFAKDGAPDTVDCGAGNDAASVDKVDGVIDCESLSPRTLATVAASVQRRFKPGGRTAVLKLVVRGPRGASIRVSCGGRGKGCPFRARKIARARARTALTGLFRGARLRPGAVLEVRVTVPDAIGRVFSFRVRNKKPPAAQTRCLLPGASRPTACG